MADPREATDLVKWAIAERDMAPHVPVLIELASECKKIVEFGVRGAVSTWAFLDGLPETGQLWSVDTVNCTVPPRVQKDSRWTFVLGNDLDPETRTKLPKRADLVMIDTNHEHEHTAQELLVARSFVPKRILLHDAEWPGVAPAIEAFCAEQGWHVAAFHEAHDEKGPFSLAVLERDA